MGMGSELLVQLTLRTKDVNTKQTLEDIINSAHGVELAVKQATAGASSAFSGMANASNLARSVVAGLGIGFSVAAIVSQIKLAIQEFGRLRDEAVKLDTTVQQLGGIKLFAELNDLNLDDVSSQIRNLDRAIREAVVGNVEMQEAFEQLQIITGDQAFAFENLKNNATSLVDLWEKIISAGGGLSDSWQSNTLLARTLGKNVRDLKPAFESGAEGIAKAKAVFNELNPEADKTAQKIKELADIWAGMKTTAASWAVNAFTGFTDFMERVGASASDAIDKVNDLMSSMESNPRARVSVSVGDISGIEAVTRAVQAQAQGIEKTIRTALDNSKQIAQVARSIQFSAGPVGGAITPKIKTDEQRRAEEEAARQVIELRKQAEQKVTQLIEAEQQRRLSQYVDGINQLAEIEIAKYRELLDRKLINQQQFDDAVAAIRSANDAKVQAQLEKDFDKQDAIQDRVISSLNAKYHEYQETVKRENEQIAENTKTVQDHISKTTISGIDKRLAAEIAAAEKSKATEKEKQDYIDQITREAKEMRRKVEVDSLEASDNIFDGVSAGLLRWRNENELTAKSISELTVNGVDALADRTSSLFISIANGTAQGKDAWKAFALSVLADIQSMIIRMTVLRAMKAAIGESSPSEGGAGGLLGGLLSFLPGIGGGGGGYGLNTIPVSFAAAGGPANGWTVVGERGPELVRLPTGSRVFSNEDSNAIAGGSSTKVTNITQNLNLSVTAMDGRSVEALAARPEFQRAVKALGREAMGRDLGTRQSVRGTL